MAAIGEQDFIAADQGPGDLYSPYAIDFFAAVSFGLLPRYRRVITRGNNPDVDAGPEDIWTGGGSYPWMTGATDLEIVSSSTADTAAGTGARTVRIRGLNTAYEEIETIVTLNGTTPVALAIPFFRINNVDLVSAGSGLINAGDVTTRDAGAGTTRAIMPTGYGTDRQSQFTVPAGHTLVVYDTITSINRPTSSRDATVTAYMGVPANSFYRLLTETSVNGNPFQFARHAPFPVAEKNDLGMRVTYVSATNTDITGAIVGVLRDNR